jgi:hypothetical protein
MLEVMEGVLLFKAKKNEGEMMSGNTTGMPIEPNSVFWFLG